MSADLAYELHNWFEGTGPHLLQHRCLLPQVLALLHHCLPVGGLLPLSIPA
jgi:hypothetical protein